MDKRPALPSLRLGWGPLSPVLRHLPEVLVALHLRSPHPPPLPHGITSGSASGEPPTKSFPRGVFSQVMTIMTHY